jgi:hypothetical protein
VPSTTAQQQGEEFVQLIFASEPNHLDALARSSRMAMRVIACLSLASSRGEFKIELWNRQIVEVKP